VGARGFIGRNGYGRHWRDRQSHHQPEQRRRGATDGDAISHQAEMTPMGAHLLAICSNKVPFVSYPSSRHSVKLSVCPFGFSLI
jgi:hypothetical protein